MNVNGERFAVLCPSCNLAIGGSCFLLPKHTKSDVSIIRISDRKPNILHGYWEKLRRLIRDVRVRRGTDVASGHHFLTPLTLKPKGNYTEQTHQSLRYNATLQIDTSKRKEFNITLFDNLKALKELHDLELVDGRWQRVREGMS